MNFENINSNKLKQNKQLGKLIKIKEKDNKSQEKNEKISDDEQQELIKQDDYFLDENDFNVQYCNNVVRGTGGYIKNVYNTTRRFSMYLIMNAFTISLFGSKNPDNLISSIDLMNVSDILSIQGSPECIQIQTKIEHKNIYPCFINVKKKYDFIQAYKFYIQCYKPVEFPINQPECSQIKEDNYAIHLD